MHGRQEVNGPRGEEEQRPATTDSDPAKELVAVALLESDAAAKKSDSHRKDDRGGASGTDVLQNDLAQQSDTDNEHEDADLHKPIGAEQFFDRGAALRAVLRTRGRRRYTER